MKNRISKKARIASMGAAVASVVAFAGLAHGHEIYWDPYTSGPTGSGGSGTFDNSTYSFYDATFNSRAETIWLGWDWSQPPADVIHFATTGGAVTVGSPTTVSTMAIDCDGYSFSGSTLTFGGYHVATAISLNTGNSTIANDLSLTFAGYGDYNFNAQKRYVSVASGSTLTLSGAINSPGPKLEAFWRRPARACSISRVR